MLFRDLCTFIATIALCAPPGRPRIAEVLYDALGDDTGFEFVEIYNPTPDPVPLAGLRLEAGDGAGPGRWTLRWTGQTGDTVRARARFVAGGAYVVPTPDATVTLDLQNGPDALRLVWPDGVTEVVGYGALAYAEYSCGAPAPDVASGQSLARTPDDADLGSNALDFRAATPSPGAANQPGLDVALSGGSLALTPEQPADGGSATLTGEVVNAGEQALDAGAVTIAGVLAGPAGELGLFEKPLGTALAPGDSARFGVTLGALPVGKQVLMVRAVLAGDQRGGNDADSLRVRVGPGPLEVSEIQFHPGAGEGEWVEVRCRAPSSVALEEFTLSDHGAARGVPQGALALAPESLAVLVQTREAFLARYPDLDPQRVIEVRPWSSLNNADDSTGLADAVVLRDRDGTRCDRADYSASGVPAGFTLERRDGIWAIALDPAGSPLRAPRAPAPLSSRFELRPRRLSATDPRVRLSWALPWPRGRVAFELYDLSGRRVGEAVPEIPVAARGEREWRAVLTPGLYLMVMRARAESGGETLSEVRPLRIEGAAP